MLTSLYASNPDTPFDTLIYTPPGLSGVAQPRFEAAFDSLRKRFQRSITVHEADDAAVRELPLCEMLPHLNHATYGNLLLPDLVSDDAFLYLDSDLIVERNIAPLLAMDLKQALIAAVPDWGYATTWAERMGIEDADTYVNNGVMLVNASLWRSERTLHSIMEWHRRLGARAGFVDQDLLNVVAKGRKLLLDPSWNVMQHALLTQETMATLDVENFEGVFHFTALPKPWSSDAPPQARALWDRHARRAPLRMADDAMSADALDRASG